MVNVNLDSVPVKMELDTGSALSLMTIKDYKEIFGNRPTLASTPVKLKTYTDGIGQVKSVSASLEVNSDATPKFFKARAVPFAIKPKVEKALDDLERQGILTKVSHSDWATPIVPVLKKSGDVRVCGNFKVTINPVLKAEQYTLPRLDDMMASLDQGKKFSKIDLRQAYFQLPLTDKSKHLTTINTSKGLSNRLVFGITSVPAIWQKTMDKILQGLPGVLCNQDDMIISGKTDQEHHDNLYRVLQRLEEHGLGANYEKCSFYQDQVVFCGIKVTKDGLYKTSDKVKAIKSMVASDLVLIHYDPSLSLKLATDASPYGLGAVLSHVTTDGERPICFASRTLV
ncbi:Pol polyprotein [Elysia marginata]|uniref:Pol polyprotein n=1 Tax=Elysia marginata TaxID=1093978 RepID=A0AAV4HXJ7_9GAST|nr:Pol polyprotein [Elysia marginata]